MGEGITNSPDVLRGRIYAKQAAGLNGSSIFTCVGRPFQTVFSGAFDGLESPFYAKCSATHLKTEEPT
jgi:hypothetical protein